MTAIANIGQTIAVYRFQIYDVNKDECVMSTRYGTLAGIVRIGGIRTGYAHEVPRGDVNDEGLTAKGYLIKVDQ
jgi:hypothetical protein